MNKQEFVDRLRMALNGRVSPGLVMDNVNYYQDYINTEIRKGRTEEEVLESLGDPRLIARTIIQTNGGDNRSGYRNTVYGNGEYREAAGQNVIVVIQRKTMATGHTRVRWEMFWRSFRAGCG